jgi:hypothetical protein
MFKNGILKPSCADKALEQNSHRTAKAIRKRGIMNNNWLCQRKKKKPTDGEFSPLSGLKNYRTREIPFYNSGLKRQYVYDKKQAKNLPPAIFF